MREYHLRPWELNELTLTECSVMLLALKDEDQAGPTISAGMDPAYARIAQEQMQAIIDRKLAYARLSPQEKLAKAYQQYA